MCVGPTTVDIAALNSSDVTQEFHEVAIFGRESAVNTASLCSLRVPRMVR